MARNKDYAIMGNWSINLCSRLEWHFNYAIEMAFNQHGKVTHYVIDKEGRRLTLFWADPSNITVREGDFEEKGKATKLPYTMDYQAIRDFVWNWLKTAPYRKEPDIDGSCTKGFRISTDYWGNAVGPYGVVSIETEWALIGK